MITPDSLIPAYIRFLIAGLSGGGAAVITHPIDLVKYRMQLNGKYGTKKVHKNSVHAVINIIRQEGFRKIYTGLSASILRQMTYTLTRIGMYTAIVDAIVPDDESSPPVYLQLAAGIISGAAGAIVGNPADIALVRMASDGAYPPKQRYRYKNCFNAIRRIYKEEGLDNLWLALLPSIFRSMVLNISTIFIYENAKNLLLRKEYVNEGMTAHLVCSTLSAMVTSVAISPLDITKTRIMMMKADDHWYVGMSDAMYKIVEKEGVQAFWKGVTPTFLRVVPHNFVVFLLMEFLTQSYKDIFLNNNKKKEC